MSLRVPSGQLLGVDAVREFNVVSDTYGASYGKRTGAQVVVYSSAKTQSATAGLITATSTTARQTQIEVKLLL